MEGSVKYPLIGFVWLMLCPLLALPYIVWGIYHQRKGAFLLFSLLLGIFAFISFPSEDKVLEAAGFEIRQPGCSACLAMNDDKVPAGKYAVSTSNRNFEGRQGPGSRTILASPLVG